MKTTHYKLKEYKITEYDSDELSWEAHFGVGSLREGRCYKKGSILFIGPAEYERLGYLMLEYTDHLKKLPAWQKMDYYCTSNDIFHCDTGRCVDKEEMNLWKYDPPRKENMSLDFNSINLGHISTVKSSEEKAYRLHRYEIIEKENGRIFWNSCSSSAGGKIGFCIIVEDILFIGPLLIAQKSYTKHQFLDHLKQLPKWERTKYFCPKFILHECKVTERKHKEEKHW